MLTDVSFTLRDVAGIIPPDVVPQWVKENVVGDYLSLIVASALVYDSSECQLSLTIEFSNDTSQYALLIKK
jgi:hypothetical protein